MFFKLQVSCEGAISTPQYLTLTRSLPIVPPTSANGGSCIAGPDGEWVVEPIVAEERLIAATIDHQRVRAECQNFDPVGHYARPDVTQLTLNRKRQSTLSIVE